MSLRWHPVLALGMFWWAWRLVRWAKSSGGAWTAPIDAALSGRTATLNLQHRTIFEMADRCSPWFWFHKQQTCLAKSLAAYYYLKRAGYDPYLLVAIDVGWSVDYNCHCWVELPETVKPRLGRPGVYPVDGCRMLLIDQTECEA